MTTDTPALPGMDDDGWIAARKGLVDRFGLAHEKVKKWSRSRTLTTYHARVKEEKVALQRAEGVAKEIDGQRGQAPNLLRWSAADYLREALTHGPDETALAVSYATCHMHDDEVKRLAEYMAKKFDEGRPATPPAKLASEHDHDRRAGGAGAEAGGDVPAAHSGSQPAGGE